MLIFLLVCSFIITSNNVVVRGEIPSGDLAIINKARSVIETYGPKLWPGFGASLPPVLVRAGQYDYLIGHPDPPPAFFRLKNTKDLYRKKGHLIPVSPATSYPVADIWSVMLPGKEELETWVRKELQQPNFSLTYYNYFQLVLHESFHAYQMTSLGGFEAVPRFGFSGLVQELQSRLRSSKQWKSRILELGRLLRKAVRSEDLSRLRVIVNQVLSHAGQQAPDQEVASFERYIQWVEGTARYVETRGLVQASIHDSDSGSPEFPSPVKIRANLYE